jgi:hypothetical protein
MAVIMAVMAVGVYLLLCLPMAVGVMVITFKIMTKLISVLNQF